MTTAVSTRYRLPARLPASRLAVLVIGLLTTLAAVAVVHQPRGLYWSDTNVIFLAPADTLHKNTYIFTTDSVIATAGLVGELVEPRGSSSGAGTQTTLLAQGARSGHQVRLPNSGGQWESNFDKPLLDVQVVGSDPDAVSKETTRLVLKIRTTLEELQRGVTPSSRITTTQLPADVTVRYSEGDPRRAMAITLLIGLLLTRLAMSWRPRLRRVGGRPKRSHPTAGPPDDPTIAPDSAAPRRALVGSTH